ncbi:dTDP-4-dehydrorhamnose reductase [uncultured Paenalcaligenes sp.]|uniref:dTDP-4-dehydrorhamnose reductase n=1 Tax=uncultured Paenalcaligenes sp. TaxID=1588925 RepID=UPI002604E8A9|nr:dTDP-4-dehydrorhamnose reductase [uncultured Paenalcaligenes sp.]
MQHVLILGKDGQVGTELQRSLSASGQVTALGRDQADLNQLGALRSTLEKIKPTIIVNAAAYTAVDKAETDQATAQRINAEAVETISHFAYQTNALVVHYSTDYVFDGTKSTPYTEQDATNPQNVYGQSKLDGEIALRHSGCQHLIFRTSWVFAGHGNNFLRTMMRLAMQREQLTVVDDQLGAPTSAELIADLTALSIWAHQHDHMPSGLYHLAASGQTSWHGFARYIVQQMVANGMNPTVTPEQVLAIPSKDYPTPATRPAFSHLDCSLLQEKLDVRLPHWQTHVRRAVAQLAKFAQI